MQTIVIGHRNPDMDAICSAIVYAEFKRKMGMADVVAARAGDTNERIDFVLKKFGSQPPISSAI
jgi:manganese-dependent inorganic pyrophosphatase